MSEQNDLKRLALEVIKFAIDDSRKKEGLVKRQAIAFLKSEHQRQSRNAWLRAADIEPEYFSRMFANKL